MSRFLVLADLATALARSIAQASAKGCSGNTDYWWATVAHPSNGQAAVVIEDSGDFGEGGLSPDERSQLQDRSQLDSAGWFLPRGPL